ncbi:MAG TPA: hypothetical protein VLC50_06845 [Actinomycetes bacterium]|nr:hypothetical protein [Actinomycetes bacterium]
MIILGFLLIIISVAAAVILIVQNTTDVDVSALGQSWTVPALWLVVAGLVTMAVAVIGLVLIRQARPRIPQHRVPREAQGTVPSQSPQGVSDREPAPDATRETTPETGEAQQPSIPLSRNEPGGSS